MGIADQQPSGVGSHSHPSAAVRHSYPLAIRNSDLSTAWSLVMRTLPYAGARFAVLFGTALATAVWWLIALGGASFFASTIHGVAGLLWFVGWVVAFGWAWRTVVRYLLYMLKAGHIAVLTELISKGYVGAGDEGMFEYGKRIVTERFGQMNAMFALDLLVSGVVRAFNRTLDFVAGLLPIPGMRDVAGLVNRVVRAATTYIDETVLSYTLARGDDDVFRASRDGLIYYAQNSREVLKTGVFIVILDKLASVAVWVVMIVPAFAIGAILPASIKGLGILFVAGLAALFAWAVRGAFLEPLFLVMVMIKFHAGVYGQPIDLEWDTQLSNISGKFVELKNRIGQPIGAGPIPDPKLAS